jgi:hypothetical protein
MTYTNAFERDILLAYILNQRLGEDTNKERRNNQRLEYI